MPKVYRFDADSTGTDSIQSLVDAGDIINIPCPTFKLFDDAARALQDEIQPGDGVIFDTISNLLETTRGDMMLGDDPKASMWEQHTKFFGDKQFLNTYRGAANLTLRRVKNLAARKAHCIIVAHEREGKDQWDSIDKRAVPFVNPAMVEDLIGACSDVFQLVHLDTDLYDGEKVVLHNGDHVLYLHRTPEHTAKFHVDASRVDPRKIPSGIVEPTMPKLCAVLHKIPSVLCVYGHPGAGKTTFAATIVEVLNTKKPTRKQPEKVNV